MQLEQGTKIWMDGRLVDWSAATLHLVSNGFQYGFSVFEGIRAYDTPLGAAIFRLDSHIARLFSSAKIIGLEVPFSRHQVMEACRETVAANSYGQCYIRPVVYPGDGGMGLDYRACKVHVGIAAWFWGEYLGEGKLEKGIRVKTSSYTRHHLNSAMTKAKAAGNYLLFQMAHTEALRQGYDEALLLDPNGCVAEGAVENIVIVRGETLITPPLTYVLEGITRDSIIRLAEHAGIEVHEQYFPRDSLYMADEAFFVGTGAEVTPVIEVDDRLIGDGRAGPVTRRLQSLFFGVVHGRNQEFTGWLAPVARPVAVAVGA